MFCKFLPWLTSFSPITTPHVIVWYFWQKKNCKGKVSSLDLYLNLADLFFVITSFSSQDHFKYFIHRGRYLLAMNSQLQTNGLLVHYIICSFKLEYLPVFFTLKFNLYLSFSRWGYHYFFAECAKYAVHKILKMYPQRNNFLINFIVIHRKSCLNNRKSAGYKIPLLGT